MSHLSITKDYLETQFRNFNDDFLINEYIKQNRLRVKILSTPTVSMLSSYQVVLEDSEGVEHPLGATIDIPKDFLVKDVTVRICEENDVPVVGYIVGDKYIDFTINAKDSSETATHLYIAFKDLIQLQAGDGINIVDDDEINVLYGKGLKINDGSAVAADVNKLEIKYGEGLNIDANDALAVKYSGAIDVDNNNAIIVKYAGGLGITGSNELKVNLNEGLDLDNNNNINIQYNDGLKLNNSNQLEVNIGVGLKINDGSAVAADEGKLEIDYNVLDAKYSHITYVNFRYTLTEPTSLVTSDGDNLITADGYYLVAEYGGGSYTPDMTYAEIKKLAAQPQQIVMGFIYDEHDVLINTTCFIGDTFFTTTLDDDGVLKLISFAYDSSEGVWKKVDFLEQVEEKIGDFVEFTAEEMSALLN